MPTPGNSCDRRFTSEMEATSISRITTSARCLATSARNSFTDRTDWTRWNEWGKEATRLCLILESLWRRTTLDCILPSEFHRRPRCAWLLQLHGGDSCADVPTTSDDEGVSGLTSGPAPFRSEARMLQPGAYRSASAGFPPCLPLLPVPCGRQRKAAFPPQKASEIFPGALPLFPVPEQSSPDAGGSLQIWATVAPAPILIHLGVACVQWKSQRTFKPLPDGKSPGPPAHPPPRHTAPGAH